MQAASPRHAATPTVPRMVAFLDDLTYGETPAATIRQELTASGNPRLTPAQDKLFHTLANDLATRAYRYAEANPGGRDQSATDAALLVIEIGRHSAARLAATFGFPAHITDHDLWAVHRATLSALTWTEVTEGHCEALRRFARALRRLTA